MWQIHYKIEEEILLLLSFVCCCYHEFVQFVIIFLCSYTRCAIWLAINLVFLKYLLFHISFWFRGVYCIWLFLFYVIIYIADNCFSYFFYSVLLDWLLSSLSSAFLFDESQISIDLLDGHKFSLFIPCRWFFLH